QLDPHHGAHPRKHDRTGPGAGGGVLGAGGGDRLRGDRRDQPAVALLPCSGLGLARQRARRLSMRGAGVSAGATGVRVEGLSKRFRHRVKGDVWAVRGVSLSVQPGEFLTLLGPSGCGKTTTLRMIAGFESPDEGRVWIGDRDVTALMANRRDIGFVFQSYALFPHLTVFDNVTYGLRIRGVERGEAARRVSEVLAMGGLEGYQGQQPHQPPGGGQQGGGGGREGGGGRTGGTAPASAPGGGAAAGGAGPRHRDPPPRAPLRRAAVESRRQAPRADARRDPATSEGAVDHRGVRHPRSGGGDGGVGPHRGDESRRGGAGGPRRGPLSPPRAAFLVCVPRTAE